MTARTAKPRPLAARLADVPKVPARSGVRALLDSAEAVALRIVGDPVVDAEVVRTADEWAEVIKADLTSAVKGIVAAGQHLARAKADVRHGEWLPMLERIGISQSAAKRLMSIAANPAISNRPTLGDLPSSIVALAELSRLPADEIEAGIADGSITSGMTIANAKALVDPAPEPVQVEPVLCRQCNADLAEQGQHEGLCDDCRPAVEAGWITLSESAATEPGPDAGAEAIGQAEDNETPGPVHRRCVECSYWFPPDMGVETGDEFTCQECCTDESASYVPPTPVPLAPKPPAAPRERQCLEYQVQAAGLDLQRAIRRIERLFNDANNAQRKKLAPQLAGLLNTAIASCQAAAEHIEQPGKKLIDTLGADS